MTAPLAVGVAVSEHVDFELQDVPKTMVFWRILYAIPFDFDSNGPYFFVSPVLQRHDLISVRGC